MEGFLLDLDRVLEFRNAQLVTRAGSGESVRRYAPADIEALWSTACRLMVFAADRGWPAVAALLLPVLTAHPSPLGDLLAHKVAAGAAAGELSLLHRAVRSGSVELVGSPPRPLTHSFITQLCLCVGEFLEVFRSCLVAKGVSSVRKVCWWVLPGSPTVLFVQSRFVS